MNGMGRWGGGLKLTPILPEKTFLKKASLIRFKGKKT